jgi:hypothetical protein
VQCPASASNIGDCTFWECTNATSTCAQSDAVTLTCVPHYEPSVPPDVPYTVLATNCAALFLLSSSAQATALQVAIYETFRIVVNVSLAASLGAGDNGAQASILVIFPSPAARNTVVAEASDSSSAFSMQNTFVLGASSLSTSTPGAPAGAESSSNAGVVAGATVGAIAAVAILGVAAYQYSRKAGQGTGHKGEGSEIMLSNFAPINSAASVHQPSCPPIQGGATFSPQGMGYVPPPPPPPPLGYPAQPVYAPTIQPQGNYSHNGQDVDAVEL